MNNQKKSDEIDPTLLDKINLLEKTPERDPELAAQTRNQFLNQVESLRLTKSKTIFGWLQGLLGLNSPQSAEISIGKRKFAISTIAAVLLVVVVLFGGASATAYASQSALPGDALYPVKTSLEQTQITLANDAYNQAQLHLEFAHRRLNEIKELLAQGRTNDVGYASSEFEHYIQEAMMASQIVQAADPVRGAELSKLVSQALLDYASALKSVLISAPEAVKPVVEKALQVSQEGAGDEVEVYGVVAAITDTEIEIEGMIYSITDLTEFEDFIQPGDMVKLHVIVTQDGVMVVREIELAEMTDDNANISGDDNDNVSDGGNENENEFDDDLNDNGSGDNSNNNESDDDSNENESNENNSGDDGQSDDNSNENQSNQNQNENDSDDDTDKSGSSKEGNSNDDSDNSNRNENESEEDDENSNESEENDNESEEEEENANGGG